MENKAPLQELDVEKIVEIIYNALNNKGYNPAAQLSGYILSEDPLYIPDWENVREVINYTDRDEILNLIIKYYFEHRFGASDANSNFSANVSVASDVNENND